MKYNRTLSKEFARLLEDGGELRWLFDFVKNHDDLDFLVGRNKTGNWISVYRGLSRIITITKTRNPRIIKIDGANAYKKISPILYGMKSIDYNFEKELEDIVGKVALNPKFNQYFNNKKEGYYQNILSRRYGICSDRNDDFVIIDKEAVIAFSNQKEKDKVLNKLQSRYKNILHDISASNPKRFGQNIGGNSIGNELDFLALDKEGNIRLIEYKHGGNTSGIYLTPI